MTEPGVPTRNETETTPRVAPCDRMRSLANAPRANQKNFVLPGIGTGGVGHSVNASTAGIRSCELFSA
jgi:hypothetical protein